MINIVGLAIGMASALLIGLWIQNEVSFDRWHARSGRIYQLYSRVWKDGYSGQQGWRLYLSRWQQ